MTQQLSPAAQAILDAAEAGLDGYIELLPPTWKSSVAAALRVAADQFFYDWNGMCCEEHLKSIAAELEAQ